MYNKILNKKIYGQWNASTYDSEWSFEDVLNNRDKDTDHLCECIILDEYKDGKVIRSLDIKKDNI